MGLAETFADTFKHCSYVPHSNSHREYGVSRREPLISPRTTVTMSDAWMDELERQIWGDGDEWEGTIPWQQVVTLPRGLVLQGKASGWGKNVVEEELRQQLAAKYTNGTAKYYMTYQNMWRVYHQCPCGHIRCDACVIPSILEYRGTMLHKGLQLDEMFLQEEPMSLAQAKAWWAEKCLVTITTKAVTRIRKWSDFTFPFGRQIRGTVVKGEEMEALQAVFGTKYPDGVAKFRISGQSVVQQCPCGKTACDKHVFPSAIALKATFPLVLKLRKKNTHFGSAFRMLDPMLKQEAKTWFENIPLKWKVTVGQKIHLQMICRCKKAHDAVPCKVKLHNCNACHALFKRADMFKNMCQNCHHKELIDCPFCTKRVSRGHYDCKPLHDSHYQQEVTGIYPPFMRRKMGKQGICMDCGEVVSYNVYHRHQYRRHHGVAPGSGYSRDYKLHKCTYCNYTSYDISNVHTHEKSHVLLRQHTCRHKCGAVFSTHSAEVLHCKRRHEGRGLSSVSTTSKRVGNFLHTVEKKKKY